MKPLEGVRVLDLGVGGVGPWAGEILAQLGADVLRIESPGGDFALAQHPRFEGESTSYLGLNGGKMSAALDLRDPEERQVFDRLLSQVDVLLYNFRPGVAERLRIDYLSLSAHFPRLIVASSVGYGRGGPYRDMQCTDPHAQALSGIASLNGKNDDCPPERFRWYGYIDATTGLVLANGILVRLLGRARTGEGGSVSTTMLASALHLQRTRLAEFFAHDGARSRWGSGSPHFVPDRIFMTSDGNIAVTVGNSEGAWAALAEVFGDVPDLWRSEWLDPVVRLGYRAEIEAFMAAELRRRPTAYWLWKMRRYGVPAERVEKHRDVFNDVRLWDSGTLVELSGPSPRGRRLVVSGAPWRFNDVRPEVFCSPKSGEHTKQVLRGDWPQREVETEGEFV